MRRLGPLTLLLAACSGPHLDEARSSLDRVTDPGAPPADVAALVAGNTAFATSLHRLLAAAPGNLVYSPYGLSFAMAMTRENLPLRKAGIDAAMGFPLPDGRLDAAFDALDLGLSSAAGASASGGGRQLGVASAIWSALALPAPYLDTLAQYYGAGVLVGSDPVAAIEAWQATQPGDPLPFAVASPCDEAIVNRVRLDAAWKVAFDPAATRAGDFHRADGRVVAATMMHEETELAVATTSPRAIELPYDGDALSMLIIVPDDLAQLEAQLDPAVLADALGRLSMARVALTLPKLAYQVTLAPLEAMQALGLPLDSGHYKISHSARIDANERGTEATALTVVSHTPSAVQQVTPFVVDRPFFFVIRDRASGTILFVGRVVDPSAASHD